MHQISTGHPHLPQASQPATVTLLELSQQFVIARKMIFTLLAKYVTARTELLNLEW